MGNDLQDCSHWAAASHGDAPAYLPATIPWSGLALSEDDFAAIAAIGRTRLVAIVGAPNAGKTTALAAWFAALRHGRRPGGLRFAGSYTLAGWYLLSRHLNHLPGDGGRFPPHTTLSSDRTASLLHLAVAAPDRAITDLFFTDVPGEWFRDWAYQPASAPGAQWIADRAAVAVLFADSDALAGDERGLARDEYKVLSARLAESVQRVIPVRAKADVELHEQMESFLAALDQELFASAAIPVTVENGAASLLSLFDEIAVDAVNPARPSPGRDDPLVIGDPFMSFRSEYLNERADA